MSESWIAVISAVITGLLSLWGVYAANRKSSALIAYRLNKLEEKVDKHNSLIERTYILEGKVDALQDDVKGLKGARSA